MPLSTVPRLHNSQVPFFVYTDADRRSHDVALADAVAVPFEEARPARGFSIYKGKEHYDGLHYFGPTRSHIPAESTSEATAMLWFEYAGAIALSAQPFVIEWPRGHKPRRHVPDLFVRHADGFGEVVDVRPADRADDPVFVASEDVCKQAGLKYSVFTGVADTLDEPSRSWADTFMVLAGYRHIRNAPPDPAPFLDEFRHGRPLLRGVNRVAKQLGQAKDLTLAQTYHLIWRRTLALNPKQRLSGISEVKA